MKTKLISLLALTAPLAGSLLNATSVEITDDVHLGVIGDVSYVYDDNIFLRTHGTVSDRYLEFSPGLELRLVPEGAASATISYQHRWTRYRDRSELDDDFSDLRLSAQYNSGVVIGSAYGSFEEMASNTTDFNLNGVLIKRDTTRAGASMKYEVSELTALKVGVDYSSVDYEMAFYTDQESVAVPVTVFYKVRPNIDLTAGVRYRTVDTKGGFQNASDYEDTYYFVGAIGELFSPVLYADISIGFQDREYKDSGLDASSGSYDITFIWTGDVKTNVFLGLSRDYRTSAIAGRTYAYTSGSLGASYQLNDKVSLNGSIQMGETEYEESLRAEDLVFFNAGVSYTPVDNIVLRASYRYADVDGNDLDGASTYEKNLIRVSASLRY